MESLWALEKFLLLCPSSQNGGERSAAWHPRTVDTFTGGKPWWRTEKRARGTAGERLQGSERDAKRCRRIKKEKYLEPVCERRAGPEDWRRRGPWWREEGKREEHSTPSESYTPFPQSPPTGVSASVRTQGDRGTSAHTHAHTHTHTYKKHTQATVSNTLWTRKRDQLQNRLAVTHTLTVAYDHNGDKRTNAQTQDSSKHKHTQNQFASLCIALCSALCCVCLGPPAHFGTAAKREGEKKEGRREV